jgi:AraC-like DNA-binding protein
LRRRSLVDRTRRRLAEAPGSPHPLPELAEWLGVSAFHFARVFRAETGLSVHQYLLRLRMAGALRQLSCYKTDLSRLALELGFSSHSHFTATFRKEFGVNPAHVRSLLDRERRCAGTRYLPWPVSRLADGTPQNHSA